jgi:enhancer of polycomb-like protein
MGKQCWDLGNANVPRKPGSKTHTCRFFKCIFIFAIFKLGDSSPDYSKPSPPTQVLTKPADGKAKDGKLAEIPIPEIRNVVSYKQDYRANYAKSQTYLRNKTFGAPPDDVVEYDLDNDDEDWLVKYNDGQNRLPGEKFEHMIWKLEVRCGEANELAMEIVAANATEKGQIISYQDKCLAMAGTGALPKGDALELLKHMSGRPAIMEAVYEYWCEKRLATGKPCLRRLQPPPAPNDANPFNCFRQREKTNRPQTRRRRENDAGSFDKMRQIRKHMEMVFAVVELQLRREEKKSDRCRSESDWQALQINLKHEPRSTHETIEAEFAKKPTCAPIKAEDLEWDPHRTITMPLSRVEIVLRPDGAYGFGGERFAPVPVPGGGGGPSQKSDRHGGSKKRRRDDRDRDRDRDVPTSTRGHGWEGGHGQGGQGRFYGAHGGGGGADGAPVGRVAGYSSPFGNSPAQIQLAIDRMGPPRALLQIEHVPAYQPPPEIPDIEMLFARELDAASLKQFVLPLGARARRCRPRVARGGRVVFDRKEPITRTPFHWETDLTDLRMEPWTPNDDGDENERTPVASIRV